ncbi:lysophospholipid acyltransferase family protein [Bergeyella zoohelcum]|uniref:1-acyl-sn-glycerol-3-phosphate acyltransferase n=1 Tax=Bergeyella zoohelcum TaxID=1015 RepID=A0A376BYV4_9FLAO|nr:lysophospholipid acyltransferase family protein [Bergeyella zoohelcum]EKB61239.1 1-acylglycerol-3-phosphate O-acyltransferase [Bergeyella zoohelcum CCUG 30536]SSZ46669.1 1-acyl-sn-glycerol-3-phosphate acyltransferase [Bergeyella zoohelcum]
MKLFTTLYNYLWRAWFVLLAFLLILLLGPFTLLFSIRPKDFPKAYIFIRLWCYILFYGMGFRYQLMNTTGQQLDRKQNYILIANHTSIMDIMLMSILHPHHPICFIGKAELAKIPLFGLIYKRICIMVDRGNIKSRARVYPLAAQKIKNGQSIVIFPEGGVPDDTSVILSPFKEGAFKIASEHQIPIAVYTFQGLKEMFPFDNKKGYPGKIKVHFHGILPPNTDAETLKTEAFCRMKKVLEVFYV